MMNIAIVGGGLVGALEACFLAKRGFLVTLFEKRSDERNKPERHGRSINLAMSHRGISALKRLNYEFLVDQEAVPVSARMIHPISGKNYSVPYDPDGRCLYSITRANLNNILLDKAQQDFNVKILFNHKLIDMNAFTGELQFLVTDENTQNSSAVSYKFDLIFGCDGTHSRVRSNLSSQTRVDLSKTYIEHGYVEIPMDADDSGSFKMDPNYLHIWPRGRYMLMALANKRSSKFTLTLFMPFEMFSKLKSGDEVIKFFEKNFPDTVKLVGEQRLKTILTNVEPGQMATVRCSPYHFEDKVVLLGDAAHAMVPFHGQGMNCGFEDCLVLEELFDKYLGPGKLQHLSSGENGDNNSNGLKKTDNIINVDGNRDVLGKIFAEYSTNRCKNGQAMCDLALYNYIVMRDLVSTRTFIIRKYIDKVLYRLFPQSWIPLYTMVTFTRIPVDQCVIKRKKQDKLLNICFYSTGTIVICSSLFLGYIRFCK